MTHGQRTISAGDVYHVTARGIGRQLIFENDRDRTAFVKSLCRFKREADIRVVGWCLMDNHVHLLLHGNLANISVLMKRLLGSYAMRFNSIYGRVGHLFQNRFSSVAVNSDRQLLETLRYIHLNPIGAGYDFRLYIWSSYHEYESGCETVTDTSLVLGMLNGRESFLALHSDGEAAHEAANLTFEGKGTRRLSAKDEREALRKVLGGISPYDLKSFDKETRNRYIAQLRQEGLSIRAIERATGIGRGVISRVKM